LHRQLTESFSSRQHQPPSYYGHHYSGLNQAEPFHSAVVSPPFNLASRLIDDGNEASITSPESAFYPTHPYIIHNMDTAGNIREETNGPTNTTATTNTPSSKKRKCPDEDEASSKKQKKSG